MRCIVLQKYWEFRREIKKAVARHATGGRLPELITTDSDEFAIRMAREGLVQGKSILAITGIRGGYQSYGREFIMQLREIAPSAIIIVFSGTSLQELGDAQRLVDAFISRFDNDSFDLIGRVIASSEAPLTIPLLGQRFPELLTRGELAR